MHPSFFAISMRCEHPRHQSRSASESTLTLDESIVLDNLSQLRREDAKQVVYDIASPSNYREHDLVREEVDSSGSSSISKFRNLKNDVAACGKADDVVVVALDLYYEQPPMPWMAKPRARSTPSSDFLTMYLT